MPLPALLVPILASLATSTATSAAVSTAASGAEKAGKYLLNQADPSSGQGPSIDSGKAGNGNSDQGPQTIWQFTKDAAGTLQKFSEKGIKSYAPPKAPGSRIGR